MLSFYTFVFVICTTLVFHCNGASIVYLINLQQYSTIQIGWTQQQVTQLIGTQGNVVSQIGTPISNLTTVQYTGSQSSFSVATFTFQGSILYSKSQIGLDTTVYSITQQQYTAIQIGWTRNQVTSLIGTKGSVTSEAGTGNTTCITVQYQPIGNSYGIVSLGFFNGNVVSKFETGFASTVNNKINLFQYKTIQIGWTQQQVTQLLGASGNILSQSGTQGSPYQMTIVQYTGSQSSSSSATFTFQGSTLSGKSQYGLDTTVYSITQQQYAAVQIGWTRNQVTSLVGSAGSVISEAGIGNTTLISVQYQPVGNSYGIVSLGFYGGKLNSKFEIGFK